MKKVARMRFSPSNLNDEASHNRHSSNSEPIVRTTGRIKKPKAVFDPSDNYLPRAAQRSLLAATTLERRASYTKSSTLSPIVPAENKDGCLVCKKKESKRPQFASKNPLIICQACQRKIHKLCLKVDYEEFESVQRNYKCEKCNICRICNGTLSNTDNEIITCSKCAKCFHLVCFPTNVIKTDDLHNWKCNKCKVYNQITNGAELPVKKIREIIGSGEPSALTSTEKSADSIISEKSSDEDTKPELKISSPCSLAQKRASTEQPSINASKNDEIETDKSMSPPEKRKKQFEQSDDTVDSVETASRNTPSKTESTALCYTPNNNFDDIPDVKEWSVGQVYDYFYKHFPKEAHVFKDEEIDGRSLLLLKRSDVVKKFPIKLGPSLRIYGLILKIQAQLNDPTLGWNCGL